MGWTATRPWTMVQQWAHSSVGRTQRRSVGGVETQRANTGTWAQRGEQAAVLLCRCVFLPLPARCSLFAVRSALFEFSLIIRQEKCLEMWLCLDGILWWLGDCQHCRPEIRRGRHFLGLLCCHFHSNRLKCKERMFIVTNKWWIRNVMNAAFNDYFKGHDEECSSPTGL